MSRNHVIVHQIRDAGMSVTAASRAYKISRQRIYQLLRAYDDCGDCSDCGDTALEPASKKPHTNPRSTTPELTARILELRHTLSANGLDAGPMTIQYHLDKEHLHVPSTSTIRRILHAHGLVTPQPKKRPKSSLHRLQSDQPNETWQSDFTEATLANGHTVEIPHWLDDHSRYLLHYSVHEKITTQIVIDSFTWCLNHYGPPQSTLTDNGLVILVR
ncbi:DDE-type integrase/transposase/recombinase [Glutamicibacter sp. 287]|uniref:DDE-type integrase/transposase/recombinase n=1 Tax=unclassified Glutamicibacter TaxID=2627139 RepID=UPI000BB6FE94|nr:DDE-type integrase/transposase/recombinase [Glutamicibacter sp. BW80]PCC29233.1 hypothetical protein CIK76_07400 [Glutamicibacter sp. BW80]